jgi:aldehyde:ferredoxin oxidoreductase
MILCKFLRGVFDDPFAEWAALLRSVTGWDVDAAELHAAARRIVLAKRVFNLREGATAADDTLPRRLLETPLELDSGRTATLTAERLQAMVADYYRARGLDGGGRPPAADLAGLYLDLGLDVVDQHNSGAAAVGSDHGTQLV